MRILLPDRGADAGALLRSLDGARWAQVVDGLAEVSMGIHLPRFRLEYEHGLKGVLVTLGMGHAFGLNGGADFSGMSPRGKDLYISEVLQKTFVGVNEEGTEAAAVSEGSVARRRFTAL